MGARSFGYRMSPKIFLAVRAGVGPAPPGRMREAQDPSGVPRWKGLAADGQAP
jgi:hypothetical protein